MGLLPDTINGKIDFFESHNTPWADNAVAIGTSSAAVTALATKTATARAKLLAQIAAQESAKSATADLRAAVNDMVSAGNAIIADIRHTALTAGDNVYVLAQIPAPATPSPVPPPGQPTDFKVELLAGGQLSFKWKCANPVNASGTIYQVSRKIGSTGDFVLIGASGTRSFVDATLPVGAAGAGSVTYKVVGIRSTSAGPEAVFLVNFGVSGGSLMSASIAPAAPKLAA